MVRDMFPAITRRQAIIFMTYARTGTMKTAAYELGISLHTMKTHMTDVYAKLEVNGIAQALYRTFGVEAQVLRRQGTIRDQLAEYVREEWLQDALRESAQAAVQTMIQTIDRRVYSEPVLPGLGPSSSG